MTKFRSLKFDPVHVQLMELRPEEIAGSPLRVAQERIIQLALCSTEAVTFMYDGRIIASMGFAILWEGVIQGWIVPTIHVKMVPVSFARVVKRYVMALAETFKCHRFQTGSYQDEFHARWMKWLGFESEGIARQFTPDKKDYVNYARLFIWPN